jgi:hypothetical protein
MENIGLISVEKLQAFLACQNIELIVIFTYETPKCTQLLMSLRFQINLVVKLMQLHLTRAEYVHHIAIFAKL